MPLPTRVGKALVDYIKNARPTTKHRQVFMMHQNNRDMPISPGGLQTAIAKLWLPAGLSNKFSGTHIFRFSAATTLRRKGHSLKTIADFLGHHSVEVTKIYAQVDLDGLRKVAQPWPNKGGAK